MRDGRYPNCPCEKTLPIMVAVREDACDYSLERCWWCGSPFPPLGAKKYCSDYCRRAAWYVLNPGALRESSARFRKNNPERAKEINRLAYERHRDARLETSAKWSKANPLRKAAAEERRRVAKRGVLGEVEMAAWLAMVAVAGGLCTYCGKTRPLTMDHRTPLSRGGRHELANLIPACKPCNSRKHTRTEEEFRTLLASELRLGEEGGAYDVAPWGSCPDIDVAARDMPGPSIDILAA